MARSPWIRCVMSGPSSSSSWSSSSSPMLISVGSSSSSPYPDRSNGSSSSSPSSSPPRLIDSVGSSSSSSSNPLNSIGPSSSSPNSSAGSSSHIVFITSSLDQLRGVRSITTCRDRLHLLSATSVGRCVFLRCPRLSAPRGATHVPGQRQQRSPDGKYPVKSRHQEGCSDVMPP